jgi:hypothetical protein
MGFIDVYLIRENGWKEDEERCYYRCLSSDNLARIDSKSNTMSKGNNDNDIVIVRATLLFQRGYST